MQPQRTRKLKNPTVNHTYKPHTHKTNGEVSNKLVEATVDAQTLEVGPEADSTEAGEAMEMPKANNMTE